MAQDSLLGIRKMLFFVGRKCTIDDASDDVSATAISIKYKIKLSHDARVYDDHA